MKWRLWVALVLACGSCCGSVGAAVPAPTGLMLNLMAMPDRVAITDAHPRFAWVMNAFDRDEVQSAYRVRVGNSAEELHREGGSLWDSGKVTSDTSCGVPYAGPALQPDHTYWWSAQTWDRQGRASTPSGAQRFHTGALRERIGLPRSSDDRITTDRYPLVQEEIAPTAVVNLGPGHAFLDFGRDAYGALRLNIDAPTAGGILVVHMGEALDGPNRVNRKPGGSVRYHRAEITLQEGLHSYTVPLEARDSRRMPAAIGPVMPFRYVEVENWPGTMTADMARQVAVHYPFDDSAARFQSSDKVLNEVWELCRYSMKATSFCGVYVDGDRERTPYEADALINQLGQYSSDREYTLARYSHEYLVLHPTWPTEWILQSVLIAWNDYLYTGDRASLAEFYDDLKAKSLASLERPDGLISTTHVPQEVLTAIHGKPIRDIVDWPAGERDGYDMRPVNTVVNAFHCRALSLMSTMAAALGKTEDAKQFSDEAARTTAALNEKLFDPATGLYVDGEGSAHSSLHANAFALALGVVPPDRAPKVAEFLQGKGMVCSVYGAQFFLEALYRAGKADHALALLTARDDRGWANMIEKVGSTITLEAWDPKYKPNLDWNHAWGAAPANIIPRMLMGIEPLEPGFRRIRICPQPGSLEQASLDLPTIKGPIHEDFESTPTRFTLNVRLPANTTADVYLPRLGSDNLKVKVDGVERAGRAEGAFVVVDGVGSGAHSLERDGEK